MSLNFVRKSKYHQTAGNYSIAAVCLKREHGKRVYSFELWQLKPKKWLAIFNTSAEAQQYANSLERKAA